MVPSYPKPAVSVCRDDLTSARLYIKQQQTESERSPDRKTEQIKRAEGLFLCGKRQFTVEVYEISKNTALRMCFLGVLN